MLKTLNLQNLILVESCSLSFEEGLTIISGESGAGKTVFTEAIALALGERADSSVIRLGAERALIEAAFDIERSPKLAALLEENGIDHSPDELLLIRREIVRNGKNRAFLNSQMIALPLLQKIGSYLIDLVGQHASTYLRSSDAQRTLVDLYGDIDVQEFSKLYVNERELKQELAELKQKNEQRAKECARLNFQLEEIVEVNLKEGEETELSAEHTRLSHFQSLSEKISRIHQTLESLIPNLHRSKGLCEAAAAIDPSLQESDELLKQGLLNLQEADAILFQYLGRMENDPYRFTFLEERLAQIHRLKQKYGNEIEAYKEQLKAKLAELDLIDQKIEGLNNQIAIAEKETNGACRELSTNRKKAAEKLENEVTSCLQELNMPGCAFTIAIAPQERTQNGEDVFNFYLKANKGEPASLVKENSSGGELSRLLLSIKTCLAEKNETLTIIFDEIDANVGGETASLVGAALHSLAKCRQVFCITHFPQVASHADNHIRVQKQEKEGRTVATLEPLGKREREKELIRMLGGKIKTLLPLLLLSSPLYSADFFFAHQEHPFHFYADGAVIGRAKIDDDCVPHSHLNYREADASIYYSWFINSQNFLTAELGDSYINLDWDENPRFTGKNYNIAIASLAYVTTYVDPMRWIVQAGATVDTRSFNFSKTGVYYGLIWGRYMYSELVGFHMGAFGYTGIKNSLLWPVAGVDWAFAPRWRLNLIFPLDASIQYSISPDWLAVLAYDGFGGPYKFPRRAHGGIGEFKDGIFEVYSEGVEVAINLTKTRLKVEAGVGWNFGGWIRIKDRHNHNGHRYDFNGAPYAQVNLAYTF